MTLVLEGTIGGLSTIFRAEVQRHVGVPAENVIPDRSPTLADVEAAYPTGPDLAEALGYGRRPPPRTIRVPGRRVQRDGVRRYVRAHTEINPEWRRRRTVLDNYSRWRRGGGAGGVRAPAQRATLEQWVADATPQSVMEVLELMVKEGATVTYFEAVFDYEPGRDRSSGASTFIWPDVFAREGFSAAVGRMPPMDWPALAATFFSSWTKAYGLDAGLLEEGGDLMAITFELGRAGQIQHEYRQ